MFETALVNSTVATQQYSNPIAKDFFDNLELVTEAIKLNGGKATFSILVPIIGNPPTIPDTPDSDTFEEVYNEITQYSTMVLNVEKKLLTYAKG